MPFVAGLDLGKLSDFTAMAILEQSRRPAPGRADMTETHYFVGHLHRFPRRTPYVSIPDGPPGIVESVKATMGRMKGVPLAIDQTGVGVAVVDFFRRARLPCFLRPITITAGAKITPVPDESGFHVPKKELVSTLEVLMQNRRLTVAGGMPESNLLRTELANFSTKITKASNESFGTWRDGDHDDLVLAVMLACWLAENSGLSCDGKITVPGIGKDKDQKGNCMAARAPKGVFNDDGNQGGW